MMIFRSVTQYDSVQCGRKEKLQRLNKPNWTKTSIEKLVSICVNGLHEARMESTSWRIRKHQHRSTRPDLRLNHLPGTAWHNMAQHDTAWQRLWGTGDRMRQQETGWEIGCTQAAHSRNPICGPDHWVVHALEASIVNVIIDDHSWQFLSSVSQIASWHFLHQWGLNKRAHMLPTCCLYLQLRPPSRKKK